VIEAEDSAATARVRRSVTARSAWGEVSYRRSVKTLLALVCLILLPKKVMISLAKRRTLI
jgi:hypothetical protein